MADAEVLFLVAGRDKAEALARALDGAALPAERIQPRSGRLLWYVDRGVVQGLECGFAGRKA